LLNLPIRINFKDHYLEDIEEADIVFVSQVWFKYPQNMPTLENLKDDGVSFKTITNLYFELAPCSIISVTGTNGKTTTARLIHSIFEVWENRLKTPQPLFSGGTIKSGRVVYFAGNDRQNIQVLDKLGEMEKENVLILETSSTQLLLNSGISPHIGIITNISPNHLDDHGSFENYIEAKKNLIRYQKKGDFAILNYNNNQTKKIAEEFQNKAFLFSIKDQLVEGCFIKDNNIIARKNNNETILLSIDDIKIPGKHNLENVLAAASCAHLYGIKPEIIKDGISKYIGIKHRLKLLYNINGIKYYDDTQATTPEATIAGIESFDGDIILLSGGDDKGMQYKKLAERINDKVKFLILFPGDASEKIEELIDRNKVNFIKVKDFSEAIKILKRYYKKTDLTKGGAVLISPGSAHFYSKYVENTNKDLREWIKLMKQ
ncbi:MAG: UDP-N-acetylmuramoyl-L-alanine--D-glutamate ligase, partial [Candidatus Pacebacteria bacterium]|nr:UDP-N-acetylmuramoyl-L-alanine--D-glutamate ligase [Candidatus Paceibacterota bacterium]